MGDMGKNRNFSKLLAWCFLALFCVVQFQSSAHSHPVDDAHLTHECTICVAAAHLDDADIVGSHFIVLVQSSALQKAYFEETPTQFAVVQVNARAPPFSVHL